jgi:hypothetical protein
MPADTAGSTPLRGIRAFAWVNVVLGVAGTGWGGYLLYYGIVFAIESRKLEETPPSDPCGALLALVFQPFFDTLYPVLLILGGSTILTHVLMLVAGVGLFQRAPWGRTLTLVAAAMFLVTAGGVIGVAYSVPAFLLLTKPEWKAALASDRPTAPPAPAADGAVPGAP